MRRSIKLSFTLLVLLACLSIFGIGFSSWTIFLDYDSTTENDSSVTTEDIINSDDYVKFEVDNSRMFKYCRYGFVNSSDNVVDKGTLPINFTVENLDTFKNKFDNEGFDSVEIIIVLKYDNSKLSDGKGAFNLFESKDNQYNFNIDIKETQNNIYSLDKNNDGNINNDYIVTYEANQCSITFDLDNLLELNSYQFGIDYNFVLQQATEEARHAYFETNMYKTIRKPNLFSLSVKIHGYKASEAGDQ